jgi:CRP/FNR family cyclic AMP-dependent transcriptional regulator
VPIWQIRRLIFDFWQALAFLRATLRLAIFSQGDPAQELFIIQSGEVEIRLGNRVLETLPQYSIFGEMALIDNAPRSATAIAASDAKLVPVSEKQFLFLISNTPYFALNVMRVMAQRLRAANTAL